MKLEPTGERMVLEYYKSSPEDFVIYLIHMASYRFAEQFTRGKRVLDFGCGSGYGSAQIAQTADQVMAVDVADDAVAHARERFPRTNLEFRTIDPLAALPFADGSFDVILSFQVFEHVTDASHYLEEVRRVLAPGGQLVLITPDRSTRLLPFQRPWNRWHVREYGKRELHWLLAQHFEKVEVLGMTARPEMIGYELRRCNRVKWLMLPFTLPIMPDRWRVACLNLVHRVRGRRTGQPKEYPFSIDDVRITADAAPSVNLVAVAS
jgi:SAM-dependent methyltransferase